MFYRCATHVLDGEAEAQTMRQGIEQAHIKTQPRRGHDGAAIEFSVLGEPLGGDANGGIAEQWLQRRDAIAIAVGQAEHILR